MAEINARTRTMLDEVSQIQVGTRFTESKGRVVEVLRQTQNLERGEHAEKKQKAEQPTSQMRQLHSGNGCLGHV